MNAPIDRPTAARPVVSAPKPREIGAVNWIGLWTLYRKEVHRFFKIIMQALLAPVVTTLLFFAVFALALGGLVRQIGDVPFMQFLGPGLIIMTMAQNAFANTSSSIVGGKISNIMVDVMMPPLTPLEWCIAYVMGGATRGLMVGCTTLTGVLLFVQLPVHDPLVILVHAILGSMMLSLLGLITGIWAEKFDHVASVTNFVVTPLTFLSGTFYRIERLPEAWQQIALVNPFFYMIDGFRYGFIGVADSDIATGIAVMSGVTLALWAVALRMVATGYKLKS